ncbi:MAG TPA: glutamine-hydrolyzing carbamoyl-phosphate synthase small subunit, partial [Herpetosiphonaceae bacterium]|nr:glutamine-hydrolyzing carbamoyl-phosphate synthase small subunit [Herpetosiphonaceae bacterium]
MNAVLVLEDGRVFAGRSFGATGETTGEVVFATGMTGYQEVLTDPSYAGQIVTMTVPHIGNTGVNLLDREAERPYVSGFLVRAYSEDYSSWRAGNSLAQYLREHNIIALTDIDTRALTRHIRAVGAMRAAISTERDDVAALAELARGAAPMVGLDLASGVGTRTIYTWNEGTPAEWEPGPDDDHARASIHPLPASSHHVVAYDFGLKRNILRKLVDHGCHVTVVPGDTPAADVLKLRPSGVFLSNGPGDPATLDYAVDNIHRLLGKVPMFGICLGHQLMGLAVGGQTYKLPFGHHGCNHPVKDLRDNHVQITSQNHGFAVAQESLPKDVIVTHRNLNDGTVEGLRHTRYPAFSVQYHPEAAPGPHDADPLFNEFVEMME